MKQILLLIATLFLFSASCRKHKPVNPVDQLPPETQTGTNAFGCLVNGQVFKPGGAQLSGGSLQCNYQFVNGGFYFRLSAVKGSGNSQTAVSLFTDSLSVKEGEKLTLIARAKANAYGQYFGNSGSISDRLYETSVTFAGELWLKKFDTINQIASGTFWFTAVNANGDIVKITDGRFDVHYTR